MNGRTYWRRPNPGPAGVDPADLARQRHRSMILAEGVTVTHLLAIAGPPFTLCNLIRGDAAVPATSGKPICQHCARLRDEWLEVPA